MRMSQITLWDGPLPTIRPSIKSLSKSRVTAGLQCHKRLYLECYQWDRRDPLDLSRQALMQASRQVGAVARLRFPGGALIAEDYLNHDEAARATREAMKNPEIPAVYEAAFTFEDIRIRIDILARATQGTWDLVEVKSSKQVKDEYLFDVAIQLHVVEGAGVPIREASLLHLNGDYVWPGGPYDHHLLFALENLTEEVRQRTPDLLRHVGAMRVPLWEWMPPDIPVGVHCQRPHRCPFYGTCHEDEVEHPLHTLPRADPRLRRRLAGLGIADIREIPADFDGLSALQRRVRDCLVRGLPFVDPDLTRELSAIPYPIHFLDFESCSPPLPVIPGTRPFEQTPFQWSDHVLLADGREEHHEYLHDLRTDPRRELALSLLDALRGAGAIVVYSGFEARTMRALAEALPDLGELLLEHAETRMVDLHRLIHAHYYHPNLRGSFSIKDVLPVVVEGFGYDDLAIRDGSQAALAFSEITDPDRSQGDRELLRGQLKAYCKRDTEAIMRLFLALKGSA